MKKAIKGTRAEEEVGIRKQHPAARRHQAMLGKVVRRRLRRPKVSIVLGRRERGLVMLYL